MKSEQELADLDVAARALGTEFRLCVVTPPPHHSMVPPYHSTSLVDTIGLLLRWMRSIIANLEVLSVAAQKRFAGARITLDIFLAHVADAQRGEHLDAGASPRDHSGAARVDLDRGRAGGVVKAGARRRVNKRRPGLSVFARAVHVALERAWRDRLALTITVAVDGGEACAELRDRSGAVVWSQSAAGVQLPLAASVLVRDSRHSDAQISKPAPASHIHIVVQAGPLWFGLVLPLGLLELMAQVSAGRAVVSSVTRMGGAPN